MLSKINPKISVLFVAIFAVAMSRLLPHPPNFTAVGAMAIFGGASMKNSWTAILVPLSALFLSDLLINNIFYSSYYGGFVLFGETSGWIYSGFILMAVLAHFAIRSFKVLPIVSTALAGSILFFLLTNLGAWMYNPMYTNDFTGLLTAYTAGLPFLLNAMLGTLVFSGIFFSAYYVALEKNVSWLFVK